MFLINFNIKMSSYFILGDGYSKPERGFITTWENINAQVKIDENRSFDIIGSGFSTFKNIKYYFIFNTVKNIHNDYHLIKTLYKIKDNKLKYLNSLEYNIIKYNLNELNFYLKCGTIKGNINFKKNDKFYKL
jgi:hypothetical protein